MRVNILWKLILTIALPLLAIYAIVNVIEFRSLQRQAYADVEQQLTEVANRFAEHFDGTLSTIEQVARSTAEFVEIQPDLAVDHVWRVLERNIQQNELIYGAAYATNPKGNRTGGAPYVHRLLDTDGRPSEDLARLDIAETVPTFRTLSWFKDPLDSGRAVWTEPYYDEGAGNILMCTYSVPVMAAGRIDAITTVDLPLKQLQQEISFDGLSEGDFYIISQNGTFISHPDPTRIMNSNVRDILNDRSSEQFKLFQESVLAGRSGSMFIPDLIDGEAHWVSFSPIESTGWTFAAAFPETKIMAPVFEDLQRDTTIAVAGLAINILAIIVISFLFTRPIRHLATAMHRITIGQLDAKVDKARSRDEFGDLARGFNTMVDTLRTNIDQLAAERADRRIVDNELQLAREIQSSLQPDQDMSPLVDDHWRLYAENLPARSVAGDFYDCWRVGDRLAVVMADVSGKGVPAAFYMAVTRTMLRNLAQQINEPAELLNTGNRFLCEQSIGSMFVTLFYGLLDLKTGRLDYANAGHLPPVLLHSASGEARTVAPATGTVLGILPEQHWSTGTLTMAPGDMLMLYTDGVTEAMDPDGVMLEEAGLLEIIRRHAALPVEQLGRTIIEAVDAYQDGEQADDVTVLLIQQQGPDAPMPDTA